MESLPNDSVVVSGEQPLRTWLEGIGDPALEDEISRYAVERLGDVGNTVLELKLKDGTGPVVLGICDVPYDALAGPIRLCAESDG